MANWSRHIFFMAVPPKLCHIKLQYRLPFSRDLKRPLTAICRFYVLFCPPQKLIIFANLSSSLFGARAKSTRIYMEIAFIVECFWLHRIFIQGISLGFSIFPFEIPCFPKWGYYLALTGAAVFCFSYPTQKRKTSRTAEPEDIRGVQPPKVGSIPPAPLLQR